jgi:hypothetical protein
LLNRDKAVLKGPTTRIDSHEEASTRHTMNTERFLTVRRPRHIKSPHKQIPVSRCLVRVPGNSNVLRDASYNDRILTTGQLTGFGHIELMLETQSIHACAVIVLMTQLTLLYP